MAAVFMNPKSAELELEGMGGEAVDGLQREATPSRMACHCHNSAASSSHYENVAISVPSTPLPLPSSTVPDLAKTDETALGPFPSQSMANDRPLAARNLSVGASLPSPNDARHSVSQMGSPNSCFAKTKLFYEHSPLRHFAPFLLLIAYALFGALLFFLLENEHERRLLENEQRHLDALRSRTLQRLEGTLRESSRNRLSRSRKVLADHERDFVTSKVPEGTLEWNYLGALFYVGTVFTTIGYGNITPRTTPGQALSIVYAIVGIPLVLAILNQTSKRMTKWLSEKWICYRGRIKAKHHHHLAESALEEGTLGGAGGTRRADEADEEREEPMESRTIPVCMALSIVSGYVCTIAAIFLIWESRWSYFTSFYFICISCLTIGLGDVVPDHPYMLILMFVFVILGLSFVSMLLSVIQIKMEEWLYKMMIRMQKEYQKALWDVSDPTERDRIIAQMFAKEPWYMRQLAPLCVSDTQKSKLENLAQSYEKATTPANTRGTQTEQRREGSQGTKGAQTDQPDGDKSLTLRAAKTEDEYVSAQAALLSRSRSLSRSISDATSLPMDPASISPRHFCSREAQTEVSGNILERMERELEKEEKERKKEEREKEEKVREKEENERKEEKERKKEEKEREKEEKERKKEEKEEKERKEEEKEKEEKERKKEEKERARKMHSKAVGTGSDFVVRKEHRGTQLRPAISNKRTDTKGLIRTEDRSVDSAELIKKCTVKGVQTEADKGRSVQTMFPSQEEEPSLLMKADQRRRLFSLTGREAEFEEEEAAVDAWAQCSPPPELCEIGVQTLCCPSGVFEVESIVERLLEDEEEASNSGSGRRERSESVAATVGDDLEDFLNMAYPGRTEKKDLVIQTDDSYLRIARRLDKLRTNRTDINVYCTGSNPPPRKNADGRRKSLRFLEPIRDSFRPRRQSKTPEVEGKAVAGGVDFDEAGTSQQRRTNGDRVAQLVATHEHGIHHDSPPPSAMATAAGRARKNARHVRLMDDDDGGGRDG